MFKKELIFYLKNALHRLENDECTTEEIESTTKAIRNNVCTYTTIKDVAEQFDKHPRDVHNAINRNRWGNKLKAIRKVFYRANEIYDVAPNKWKSKD